MNHEKMDRFHGPYRILTAHAPCRQQDIYSDVSVRNVQTEFTMTVCLILLALWLLIFAVAIILCRQHRAMGFLGRIMTRFRCGGRSGLYTSKYLYYICKVIHLWN